MNSFFDTFARFKGRLVPQWRTAWRWWSTQVMAVYAAVIALLVDHSATAIGFAAFLPNGPLRLLVLAAIFLAVFAPGLVARLVGQNGKDNHRGR